MTMDIKHTRIYKKWRAARKLRNRKDHPEILMVQTASMCNAACSSCPYPMLTKAKAIPHGIMTDSLFDRIVDEARRWELKRISPYWNNEPFLDPKFMPRLEQLRSAFPDPDGREPSRTIELHLTGHMDRFAWSFNGVKFSSAEPIRLTYGEREIGRAHV